MTEFVVVKMLCNWDSGTDCKKSLSSEVGNLKFPTILGRSNLENISYDEGKTVLVQKTDDDIK
jgi:hypothetical protein